MANEAERETEPGVWGACGCGCCRYHRQLLRWEVRHPLPGEVVMTQPGPDQGVAVTIEPFHGGFRAGYCPYHKCGDYCGEGGEVCPGLRRVAEEMLAKKLEHYRSEGFERMPGTFGGVMLQQDIDQVRELLAIGCLKPECDGGYVPCEGALDFSSDHSAITHALVPCPDCQPDARKAAEDAD